MSKLNNYYIYVEDRIKPIKLKVTEKEKLRYQTHFNGKANSGEYYIFQVSIYAPNKILPNVNVKISDFTSKSYTISSKLVTCFNLEGINANGHYFTKRLDIEKGKQQVLWFGIKLPQDLPRGKYTGNIEIFSEKEILDTVFIDLEVCGENLEDYGDGEPWRLSKLRWFNSSTALDDKVTKPYTPVEIKNCKLNILGREVVLGKTGLPVSIKSYFAESLDKYVDDGYEILSQPLDFKINLGHNIIKLEETGFKYTLINSSKAV